MMDVNILFMVLLATLIPDTRVGHWPIRGQNGEIRPIRALDGAYLISGMRQRVKTVKIQHVSVATCAGHVRHVGHVGHVGPGSLVADGDPVPGQRLGPVQILVILLTVEPQLMLDTTRISDY